ncbi:unnamed protein product [Medioppia subpectinata]|uniref:maleylacetoacetate isomerase n=1 Tax=Medioppia subpectinata TaxID=1979941 RepID=A0A7R9L457_9ACAR|nr:unnamed protein product [Medioppia subpectinata]CAG2114969.1 unnamed protein product [Medioppia subpectinata]
MTTKPILYNSYLSSCSWRVRIALDIKGIEYEYKAVNLHTSEQFSPEFERLNPCHQVPALVIDGDRVVVESIAIIDYLEDKYGDSGVPSLLPSDIFLRARARAIAQAVVAGIQPLQNDSVLEKVGKMTAIDPKKDPEVEEKLWAKYWISSRFRSLEKLLAETSGRCCVGDTVSVADVCLAPQVFNAINLGLDVNQLFPKIHNIYVYLLTLDAFRRSHPYRQPDCPQDLKH